MGKALGALCAALTLTPSAWGAQGPALRVLGTSPLRLAGLHFVAGEQVRVTLVTGTGTATRPVRASASGGFVVGFPAKPAARCKGPLAVRAEGAKGSRVVIRLGPPRDCAPVEQAPKSGASY